MRTGTGTKNKSISKNGNGIRLKAWLNCSGISLGAADKQTDKICKPFSSVYWSMSKKKYVLRIDKEVCEEYGIEPAQTERRLRMTKCGECKYNKRDWTNPNNPDYYCSNEGSDNYGYNTGYSDGCAEAETR